MILDILRYSAYFFIVVAFSILFVIANVFCSFVLLGRGVVFFNHNFILFPMLKLTCWLFNIKIVVNGAEKIIHPAILLPKHESTFDIPLLMSIFLYPCFIMKDEYKFPPLLGRRLSKQYGILRIKRNEAISSMRAMVSFALNSIKSGRDVIVFPEGSRSTRNVLPIKHGVFFMYKHCNCDFFPVRIENVGTCFGKDVLRRKRSGVVTVTIEDKLPKCLDRSGFIEHLTKSIAYRSSDS